MSSVRVVLVRPRDPNNIGAVARAMKNFGFRDLWVVSPYPKTWEEVTSAPNAKDVMEAAHLAASLDEAIADCNLVIGTGDARRAAGETRSITPLKMSERLQQASYRVALLFGNEKHGLTKEDFSKCHFLMTIPTQPDCPSMNLGQSVAVCLYELARTQPLPAAPPVEMPPAATTEAAMQLAIALLHEVRFVLPGNENDKVRRIRGGLMKYQLSSYDLNILCGIMQKTLKALRRTTSATE